MGEVLDGFAVVRAERDGYRETLCAALERIGELQRELAAKGDQLAALREEIRARGDRWQA